MTVMLPITPAAAACAATLSFDAAQAMLAAHAVPLGTETVRLAKAGRRVLAEPVHARVDAPCYDAAAMDGFAIAEADFAARICRYRLVGEAYPGQSWRGQLGPQEAVRIMTGAQMPVGSDRVVVREHAVSSGGEVLIDSPPTAKTHVRARASDIARGSRVLPVGRILDPRALVVASAADVDAVTVWRRPRVRVIANGDELSAPGSAAIANKIPDSLSQAILLMVRQWGGQPMGAVLTPDNVSELFGAAETACDDGDVIVMVGGASKGDRDLAKRALEPLDLEYVFADVAIKPGKPVWYGRIGHRHVLGLPGNPTAAMTVARLFLAPLLTGLGGRGVHAALKWTDAPLLAPVADAGPREAFLCAELSDDGIRVIERQSASAQHMLAAADVLVRRPRHAPAGKVGDIIPMLRF